LFLEATMTSYNCQCVDETDNETLLQLRTRLLRRLGYGSTAANPPPGMADTVDEFLISQNRLMYQKYPALRTRRFFRWSLLEGERFYGLADNDENVTTEVVTLTIASPCVVTLTAHGFVAAQEVVFTTTGALPTGLVAGTTYYVLNPTTDTFQVAATAGGAAINTTGTQSGVHTATVQPVATCVFHLDITKDIAGVYVRDLNGAWLPMVAGINPQLYTMVDQPGIPSYYEIRQCIEVYPAPQADGYELWVKAHSKLLDFAASGDKPSTDSELVFLQALADAKAHYGQPDANTVAARAKSYLFDLVSSTHLTKRYIPGVSPLPPAIMPIFLPLDGAPS
jgi:hypothetical protein